MQPILMLAIVGVAAIALGTGFLNNNIDLWIQQFGVGSGNVETPGVGPPGPILDRLRAGRYW